MINKQPIVYIIRAANKKTFREIHQEIRAAQAKPIELFRSLASLL
jgi:hypothetical protein